MSSSSTSRGSAMLQVSGPNESTVAYATYGKIFDECAAQKFSKYASRFTCVYFLLSVSQILFTTFGALFQTTTLTSELGETVEQALNSASIALGFMAAIMGAILHISRVQVAAYECAFAYATLSLYLNSRKAMPIHLYNAVMKTNTLCLRMPKRCGAAPV